ncbi:MAG: hypothetical protein QG635_924 [Bacteroidota bacterium]|nr:hypothetical protein [Bacteroidota bacterium]
MEMSIPPEQNVEIKVKERDLMSIMVRDDGKIFWFIGNDDPEAIELKKIKSLAVRENLKDDERNKLITVLKVSDEAPYGLLISILDQLNLAELDLTTEMAKLKDAEGNPLKRERRFTIAPFEEADMEKIKDL